MAPPTGLHKILRAAAPTERTRVPGVAVLDAALYRRYARVRRIEDRILEPRGAFANIEKNPSATVIRTPRSRLKWNVQLG